MRELSVYFCKNCGYYAYYQVLKNAVCPRCDVEMLLLNTSYKNFTNLDCKERDILICQEIIDTSSPFIKRLSAPHKENNSRELMARMIRQIEDLEKENHKLDDTVKWMHQMIWDLIRERESWNKTGT